MPDIVRRLLGRLSGRREQQLELRIQRLEAALQDAKSRNAALAAQLNDQRAKTRELYARTKEYAARLNAQA